MLTNSEKLWLKTRDSYEHFSCRYCPGLPYYGPFTPAHGRPCARWCFKQKERKACWLASYYEDAAIFEARVAAKLANIHFGTEDCAYCSNHINVNEYCGECKTASTDRKCLACRLKYARLKVEEEMDGIPV